MAVTTKAKNKIRQSLNEQALKASAIAKETLERKFKNRKIEYDEPTMMRLIKRMGYKHVNEFYQAISEEVLDVNAVIDRYMEILKRVENPQSETISAEHFIPELHETHVPENSDVLIIDNNIKGVEYSLAKCCNPIYGDNVFGFVTINRGIKIHRTDCPNAVRLRESMGYRVIRAAWAGKGASQYAVTLHVVGNDDIGIVNNITSIINKEKNVLLRGISIQSSEDGLFSGTLTIMINDQKQLNQLVKKLQTVKGVKNISR